MIKSPFYALAYYHFTDIEDPHAEVKKHKKFFENLDATGRIYISEEGINGQMSASFEAANQYMEWLRADPRFSDIWFKIHTLEENIFPRMTVKYREQLVAIDEKVDVHEGAEHVSPEKWKQMLDSEEYLVLDVRNQYEWEIGHFEGATLPPLKTFREFPSYAEKLSKEVDPKKTRVMMYCTGGIRCEIYSVLLKNKGFESVYQLDGGVINYGEKVGSEKWKGKLFVFDDRLAIPIDGKEAEPITQCTFCQKACDTYYNCGNMDCNTLFIACSDCIQTQEGCCQKSCRQAPRVRERKEGNKPFRRKSVDGVRSNSSNV